MSTEIQQTSTVQEMIANRRTGRRKENIHTISCKLDLSARNATSAIASEVAAGGFMTSRRGLSPSFPFGSVAAEGGLVAGEVVGADGVVDTVCRVGKPVRYRHPASRQPTEFAARSGSRGGRRNRCGGVT